MCILLINTLILDGGDVIEAGDNQIRLIEVVLSVCITNPYSFYTCDMATKSPLNMCSSGSNLQYLSIPLLYCIYTNCESFKSNQINSTLT